MDSVIWTWTFVLDPALGWVDFFPSSFESPARLTVCYFIGVCDLFWIFPRSFAIGNGGNIALLLPLVFASTSCDTGGWYSDISISEYTVSDLCPYHYLGKQNVLLYLPKWSYLELKTLFKIMSWMKMKCIMRWPAYCTKYRYWVKGETPLRLHCFYLYCWERDVSKTTGTATWCLGCTIIGVSVPPVYRYTA